MHDSPRQDSRSPGEAAAADQWKGIAFTILGAALLSPDALILRLVSVDPWTALWWRAILSAVGLAVLTALLHWTRAFAIARRMGWGFLLVAVLFATSTSLFVMSVTHTYVVNTLVILRAAPLFAAIFSRFILGEPVRPVTWGAIVLVIAGIGTIFASGIGGGRLYGDLFALGGACAIAGTLTALRHLRAQSPLPALIPGVLLAAAIATAWAQPGSVSAVDLTYLSLLGLVLLPCAFALVYGAPRYLGSSEVALLMMLETVLAPVWVWLVLGEEPSARIILAGALILVTVGGHAVIVQWLRGRAAVLR